MNSLHYTSKPSHFTPSTHALEKANKACWMICLQPKLNFGLESGCCCSCSFLQWPLFKPTFSCAWTLWIFGQEAWWWTACCLFRRRHVHGHNCCCVSFSEFSAVSSLRGVPCNTWTTSLASKMVHGAGFAWRFCSKVDGHRTRPMDLRGTVHGVVCVCVLEGQLTLFEIQVFVATVACLHVLCTICVWTLVCVWHTVICLC